ncbi:MAG TPA: hypothetical protein VNI20_09565 [Fimbriimonadaceae bacterium]|nr:hypothetical protein [Fimbriimonadaceae bacterium]
MRKFIIALRIAFFATLGVAFAYAPIAGSLSLDPTGLQTSAWIAAGVIVVALLVLRWKKNFGKKAAFT